MIAERENNQFTDDLSRNANRIGLFLTLSSLIGTAIITWAAWLAQLSFISYYAGLTGLVTVIYFIGTLLIRNDRRVLGVSFLLAGVLAICTSIPLGFLDIGLVIGFLSGFLIWQISLLTLEIKYVNRATIIGVGFSLLMIGIDLFIPYQRLLIPQLTLATYIFAPSLIGFFIIIFYQNFNLYDIQTKLTTTTIAVAIIAVGAALVVLTISTRSILTDSTQVEIELRAQGVAAQVATQFDRQIDRLIILGSNQQIEAQILADTEDVVDFDPEIIDIILQSRNQIWINENSQFTVDRHLPFYSRLRNPLADLLRDYKGSFSETGQLFIINKYGAVVAMSNRTDTDRYLYNDTEWWQHITESNNNAPYIGNPIQLPDTTALGIPIAVPIRDANNNLVGAIYSTYSVNQLILSLGLNEGEDPLQTDFALIVDNQELLPLVPGQNSLVSSPFAGAVIDELFQMNFIESRSFSFARNTPNLSRNSILTAVPFSEELVIDNDDDDYVPESWGVLVSRPIEVVEEVIRSQQRIQVFIGLLVIVITTIIAGLLARAVSNPILSLSGVAQRLESGELSARAQVTSVDEVGSLSIAFNRMAEQSQRLVNQLETRVAERTQALEASFRVSQTISSITDKDALVNAVVNQLQSAFEYYHVHIYLLDKSKKQLRLVAGSGEPGKQLLDAEHSLEMGRGLVGRTALSNLAVIVPDVSRDPQWVANRFLPETKSELAVPIALGDEVLGVIDVQDNEVNRLSEQDADLLRSIADQVAVALRNSEQITIAEQRASFESRVNSVREKILRTQDIESAMKTAVREIGHALGNQQTSIRLNPTENRLVQNPRTTESEDQANAGSKIKPALRDNPNTSLNGNSNDNKNGSH
ncbi:MAG: GAF domain-containing protein [Anaerolineae bacterium]